LCQYLILAYPAAFVAVAYALAVGRGRPFAWTAFGLLAIPALFVWAMGGKEVAWCALIILGLIAVLGWLRRERAENRADRRA
jgi:hypothetical protein